QRIEACPGRVDLAFVLADLGPAQPALVAAQSRVQEQVAQGEDAGDVEKVEPPARQGVVQLAQVAVPDVPGRLELLAGLASLRHEHGEQEAGHDRYHGDDRDVDAPARMDEI